MEMQTLQLAIDINASKEKVWDVLLQDETYRIWTSVFHPGSYAETDWQQGSKVLFNSPEGDGLVSRILLHRPQEIITIEHLGVLRDGKEYYEGEAVEGWKGAKETYILEGENGKTRLIIEQDISEKDADWFTKIWENALQKVKELSEASN